MHMAEYSTISKSEIKKAALPFIISTVNSTASRNIEGIPLLCPPEVKNIIGKNRINITVTVRMYAVWNLPVLWV